MKSLEEKKLLVKMSRMLGQPVDQELLESIEREEALSKTLFKEETKPNKIIGYQEGTTFLNRKPIIEEVKPTPEPVFEPPFPKEEDRINQVVNALSKTSPPQQNVYRDKELEGMRRTIAEMMQKITTMSWGGGGTGVVRIGATDDFDKTSYAEGRYLKWTNGMFRLSDVAADVSGSTSFGSFSDTEPTDHVATAINTPQIVNITTTDIARGHHLGSNNDIVAEFAGVYNYQFSIQVTSSTSSKQDIYIWPRVNTQDVANSASAFTISTNGGNIIPAWNFVLSMDAGDSFQLMWAVTDLNVKIHGATPVNGFHPGIPGLILTVTPVATL